MTPTYGRGGTHCLNGHELTPDNVEFRTTGSHRGRRCLTCKRQQARDWLAKGDNRTQKRVYDRDRQRAIRAAA